MDWNLVLTILGYIFSFVLLILNRVLTKNEKLAQVKAEIIERAPDLIAEAEEVYANEIKAGKLKMEYVVAVLYRLVPAKFRIFITKEDIEEMVQRAFNAADTFAQAQVDSLVDKAREFVANKTM